MTINKAELLASRLSQEDVELGEVGSVRIRSLSRAEVLKIKGKEMPLEEMERLLVSAALVDPVLTEDEVSQWQASSGAGEIEAVTQAIVRLSGLEDSASKKAVKRF